MSKRLSGWELKSFTLSGIEMNMTATIKGQSVQDEVSVIEWLDAVKDGLQQGGFLAQVTLTYETTEPH